MNFNVVCYGEILWDIFPDYKVIGGAPLNVAFRLQSLGAETYMISRLGKDENGKRALEYLKETNLHTELIQQDDRFPTGYVSVLLDEKGSATYEIFKPVAWDFIALNEPNKKLISETDIFIFGSLACRNEVSRNSLLCLIRKATFSVFDVNLRKPHYTFDLISKLMHEADFIKLNDEELDEIASELGFKSSNMKQQIQFISETTQTSTICVTRGSNGAMLYLDGNFYENLGYKVKVEDTVGAGDSFLASLIFKLYIQKEKPENALDFACRVGALVASKNGANVKIDTSEISALTIST